MAEIVGCVTQASKSFFKSVFTLVFASCSCQIDVSQSVSFEAYNCNNFINMDQLQNQSTMKGNN